jgi:hypothetical protein
VPVTNQHTSTLIRCCCRSSRITTSPPTNLSVSVHPTSDPSSLATHENLAPCTAYNYMSIETELLSSGKISFGNSFPVPCHTTAVTLTHTHGHGKMLRSIRLQRSCRVPAASVDGKRDFGAPQVPVSSTPSTHGSSGISHAQAYLLGTTEGRGLGVHSRSHGPRCFCTHTP